MLFDGIAGNDDFRRQSCSNAGTLNMPPKTLQKSAKNEKSGKS
jgi:hypothetical protein